VALIAATVALPPLTLEILDPEGKRLDDFEAKDGHGTSAPLAPGDYVLQVRGEGVGAAPMPFAIRPGSVTQLDVRLLPGSIAMIRCTLPADADPGQQVEIVVRSAAGAVVLRGSAWRHGNQCEL
jgi:hypothetical protein